MMRCASILSVDSALLKRVGSQTKVLLLDIDNTVLAPKASTVDPLIVEHVRLLSRQFRILLCTNNLTERQRRVAVTLDLPILMRAMKTFTFRIKPWLTSQGVSIRDVVVIGDQWVTDGLLAKALAIPLVLLDPMAEDTHLVTRLLRRLEKRWKK